MIDAGIIAQRSFLRAPVSFPLDIILRYEPSVLSFSLSLGFFCFPIGTWCLSNRRNSHHDVLFPARPGPSGLLLPDHPGLRQSCPWRRLPHRRGLDQPAPLAETIAPASSEPISTASEKRPRSLAPPPPHSLSRQLAESCSRHSGYAPLRMRHPLRINREQSRLRSAWLAGEPEPQIFRRPPPF